MSNLDETKNIYSNKNKSVLIVENQADFAEELQKTFKKNYFEFVAKDQKEALNFLSTKKIDAIIFDCDLQNNEAHSFLEQIRQNENYSAIPIVAITSGDEKLQNELFELGAQDVFVKPFPTIKLFKYFENLFLLQEAVRIKHEKENLRDGLTELYNRNTFIKLAKKIIAEKPANSYVITCFDIDGFKIINDRFGHEMGDNVLKHVGNVLLKIIHRFGGIACRDMADTFFHILPYEQSVLENVSKYYYEDIKNYGLSISINAHTGRYIIDDPTLDVNLMLDRALMAVRSIKNSAETFSTFFSEKMRVTMLRKQELEDDMRTALSSDQFVIYFQPQYNYSTGAMTGAEALVRWNHPEKGIISPAEFIPLFESNGFITQLDKYVWERVCAYLRKWKDEGICIVPISVNISRHDIHALALPSTFSDLIAKNGLSPSQLHLEITESSYLDNPQELIKTVEDLKALGFVIEMDDFGAGYSSFNILKNVPVDTLKLDMEFVRQSKDNSRGGSILSSVVRMAHWLKMPVIAEGIEDKNQADYLKSIGCNLMQGYFFNKPMPAEEFQNLLHTQKLAKKPFKPVTTYVKGAIDFFDASTQATLLFNSFVGGAVIAEFDGSSVEILRMNDRFFKEIGCTREQYGETHSDIFTHVDDVSKKILYDSIQNAIKTGEEVECDIYSLPLFQNEKGLWLHIHIRFLAQNVERYVFYVIIENVTEKKELAAAKQNLMDELSGILNCMPAGILKSTVENGKFYVSFISESFANILGMSVEKLREEYNKDPMYGIHPDDVNRVAANLSKALSNKSNFDCQYRIKHADGHYLWISLIDTMVIQNGKTYFYGSITDITSVKKLQEKQAKTSEELNSLIASVPGGVISIYLTEDGIKSEYFSDGLNKTLGYTRAELSSILEKNTMGPIHPEDRAEFTAALAEAAVNLSELKKDFRLLCKNGKYIWMNLTANPIKSEDGLIRFYGSYTDIDEHIKNEEALRSENHRNRLFIEQNQIAIFNYNYATDEIEFETVYGEHGYIKKTVPTFYSYIKKSRCFASGGDACIKCMIDSVRNDPSPATMEIQANFWGSGLKWSRVSYSGITGPDGKVERLVGLISNIDEQKRHAELFKNLSGKEDESRAYDPNLIADVFAYLNKETNSNKAISQVLAAVGKYYKVSRAYVYESSEDDTFTVNSFEWCADGLEPMKDRYQRLSPISNYLKEFKEAFDSKGRFICQDLNTQPENIQHLLESHNSKATAQWLLYHDGKCAGVIGFDDCVASRQWTPSQVGTLSIITNIIGLYLFKKRDEENAAILEDFMASLDKNASYVTIIDPETYEIVYSNPAYSRVFGSPIKGVPCYEQSMNCKEKCKVCPIDAFIKSNSSLPVELHRPDGTWFIAESYPLHLNGRKLYMTTYMDITREKNAQEKLRIKENIYRIAVAHSNSLVCRYDYENHSVYLPKDVAASFHMPEIIENMPETAIKSGYVAKESEEAYRNFYKAIEERKSGVSVEMRLKLYDGTEHWFRGEYAIIGMELHKSSSAIVTFTDIDGEKNAKTIENMLEESKQLLKIVAEQSNKYIIMYDFATDELRPMDNINIQSNVIKILRNPKEYFNTDILAPESYDEMLACFTAMKNGENNIKSRFRAKSLEGKWIWMECNISTVYDTNCKPMYSIASFEDITESYKRDIEVKRYQTMCDDDSDSLLFNLDYNLTQNTLESESGRLITLALLETAHKGYTDCINFLSNNYIFKQDRKFFRITFDEARLLQAFSGGIHHGEIDVRMQTKSNLQPIYVRISYQMIYDPYSSNILLSITCNIIDAEKRAELALINRANNDELTGVMTRAAFVEKIKKRLSSATKFNHYAFAILDVDRFKTVNDSFGHIKGDAVLCEVAHVIKSKLTKQDFVGRLGGDEFGIFFELYSDEKSLNDKLAYIKHSVCALSDDKIRLSASIGVARYIIDGKSFEDLYKKADIALYKVKESGRNRYLFYTPKMYDHKIQSKSVRKFPDKNLRK